MTCQGTIYFSRRILFSEVIYFFSQVGSDEVGQFRYFYKLSLLFLPSYIKSSCTAHKTRNVFTVRVRYIVSIKRRRSELGIC